MNTRPVLSLKQLLLLAGISLAGFGCRKDTMPFL
jgi:hypothetical protein